MSENIDNGIDERIIPKWILELGRDIARACNLRLIDGLFISDVIANAVKENCPKYQNIVKDNAKTFWIARNRDETDEGLFIFKKKPYELNDSGIWDSNDKAFLVPDELFPDLTFDNSPQKVEIKIIDDENEIATYNDTHNMSQEQIQEIVANIVNCTKEVLTSEEAARYMGVSKSYLYKLTMRREIPHYKPMGKMCYFNRSELVQWLQQNRVATSSEIADRANKYCMKRNIR